MPPFLRRAMQALLRFAPQRRLAWLAALTAPVWLLPAPFGAYAGVGVSLLVVVALAIDVLMLPAAAALGVEREFPASVGIGDEIDGSYTVLNRTSRALQVELHDQLPPLVSGGVQSIALRVPGASAQRVEATMRGTSRGTSPLGALGVRVSTMLGLVSARYTFDTSDAIRILYFIFFFKH